MAKFDVYRMQGGGYILDCQADLLSDLNTRFVVPLLAQRQAPKPIGRLNPSFDIEGEPYVMVTQFAATIPATELKARVLSLAEQDFTVGNALDMLISGF